LVSAMKKYKPEFILVSAGFDGHHNDPLGELSYSPRGYQGVAKVLSNLSREHAKEKIMYVVEGGYSYDNMSQSILAILHVLEKDRF
ncbi:MAG: histone deacetylase, partial [Betaproteobacteria bacterium]|nr:histone deacetylase [Betaproteobacteria bacterium]